MKDYDLLRRSVLRKSQRLNPNLVTAGEQLQLRLVGGLYCKLPLETPKLGSGHEGGLVLAGGKQVRREPAERGGLRPRWADCRHGDNGCRRVCGWWHPSLD